MGRGPIMTAPSDGPGAKGSCTWTTSGANSRRAETVRDIVHGQGETGRAEPFTETLVPTPTFKNTAP